MNEEIMHTYFAVINRNRKGEPVEIDTIVEVTEEAKHVTVAALTARKLADESPHPAEKSIQSTYRYFDMRARYSNGGRFYILKNNLDLETILEGRDNSEFLKLLLTSAI